MKITIDNRQVQLKKGVTILDAAQTCGIYIPHLCSHPELTPYGGCRLCIVEVDGMRGYPTACTTQVENGMVVRTSTKTLQEMRREVLQLILSEHPASCLICDEAKECSQYQETIRKVGATTGCRWCPKDGDCELQKVVDHLEIDKIDFPVYYRGFPIENEEPFYDRDYNLCIYCARCVRICREHRKSSVITLKQRGRSTTVGPAFDLSHVEAECEFCGACISVCPTGALSEKSRKWAGVPQAYHPSLCPFCSLNCDIQILTRKNKVIGTLPPGDPHSAGGNLCVKGRFCLSELVNHPDRILVPQYRSPEGLEELSWDKAAQKASEHLKELKGERIAMYLSPSLTLEDLAAVKQFAERVIKSENLTTSILSWPLAAFLSLTAPSVPPEEIMRSDCIISVFFNGVYSYAPVTLAVKQAVEKGIPYYQIGWTQDTTSRFAEYSFSPSPGQEKEFFQTIVQTLEKGTGGSREIKELVKAIQNSSSPVIVLGTGILDLTQWQDILKSIKTITTLADCKVIAPYPYGNLTGLLSLIDLKFNEHVDQLIHQGKIDVLFMIGESPFHKRPPVDFIIHQNCFACPDEVNADLILPAKMWGEISGSYVDMTGKRKKARAVTKPPGIALEHREIFTRIAKAMGKKDVKFTISEVSKYIPKNFTIKLPQARYKSVAKVTVSSPSTAFPYLLVQEKTHHLLHNIHLSRLIPDMGEIAPEDTIIMNPEDAASINLGNGDSVLVESNTNKKAYPVMLRQFISPGYIFLTSSSETFAFNTNPCPVHLRKNNV